MLANFECYEGGMIVNILVKDLTLAVAEAAYVEEILIDFQYVYSKNY